MLHTPSTVRGSKDGVKTGERKFCFEMKGSEVTLGKNNCVVNGCSGRY